MTPTPVSSQKADIHAGLRLIHAAIWRMTTCRARLLDLAWTDFPAGTDAALSMTVDALVCTQNWQI
jgi:hypothetical protein